MAQKPKPDSVRFTTRGRIVIPARLRREFQIEGGMRAVVQSTPEGILVKPVTNQAIARGFGLLKRKADEKPFAREWAEHKAEEQARGEAKSERSTCDSR